VEERYKTLLVDLKDHVATVRMRMNRSEPRNALEYQLRVDLVDCFRSFSHRDNIRVVIPTGSKNAFNVGGDLRELRHGLALDNEQK
jgi:enoyl-CoA hydratase/carnithine racemase